MENKNYGEANADQNPTQEWQHRENSDRVTEPSNEEAISFENDGESRYGTDDRDERDDEAIDRDEDNDDEDNDDEDNDDDEDSDSDWGNVDPLSNPGGIPSSNDPSGPGSAV